MLYRSSGKSQLPRAEIAAAGQIAAEVSRVDPANAGQAADQQNPPLDLTAAIQDHLHLGIRPELVRAFYVFGKSDDRLGHVAGEFWLRWFENNAEAQRRLAAG